MPQKYPKPPIIEAVLHVRFATSLSEGEMARLPHLLDTHYPKTLEEADYQLALEVREGGAPVPRQTQTDRGVRLFGQDDQRIAVVRPSHITFSYLAPYPGWDVFLSSARYVFDTLREKLDYRKVISVGLRYVNRIDIPMPDNALIQPMDYLRVGMSMPTTGVSSVFRGFQSQAELDLNHDRLIARVAVATVESPLIQHASLLFDIDIIAQHDIPAKVEESWELVGRMRNDKNDIFEAGVTDKSRQLWQQGWASWQP